MRRSSLIVVVLAGCGRIGFDAPGDGGAGVGDGTLPPLPDGLPPVAACDQLSLGHRTAVARALDGAWWGWGENANAGLSIPDPDVVVPRRIDGLAGLSRIVIGAGAGAGFSADGKLHTWWGGGTGTPLLDDSTDWAEAQVAWAWGCATKQTGTLWCWGDNYLGNLGDTGNVDSVAPVQVALPAAVEAFSVDDYNACAVLVDGTLWCWGADEDGQAGVAPFAAEIDPAQVGTETIWTEVATGAVMACARGPATAIHCWGNGYHNGQTFDTAVPTPVDARTDWTRVRAKYDHTCALDGTGDVWCWGKNDYGQLATGDFDFRVPPTRVAGLPGAATDLQIGGHTVCALVGNAWWCWGRNDDGELGLGVASAPITHPIERCTL